MKHHAMKTYGRVEVWIKELLKGTIFWDIIQGALLATCFHAGFLLSLFFDPEYGGDMFLRNVGLLSTHYTALYARRRNSSNLEIFG
jgi:hypothetical protein